MLTAQEPVSPVESATENTTLTDVPLNEIVRRFECLDTLPGKDMLNM